MYVCCFLLPCVIVVAICGADNKTESQAPMTLIFTSSRFYDGEFEAEIRFNYSFPLVIIENEKIWQFNTSYTSENREIQFLTNHKEYLQKVRNALNDQMSTFSLRSECTFNETYVSCVIIHTKDTQTILIAVYYDWDLKITYADGDGKRIMYLLHAEKIQWVERWNKRNLYATWLPIHHTLLERSQPTEMNVTADVYLTDQHIVSCTAKTYVPVTFKVNTVYPGPSVYSDEGTPDDDLIYDNVTSTAYCSSATLITRKLPNKLTCVVDADVGWTAYYTRDLPDTVGHVSTDLSMTLVNYTRRAVWATSVDRTKVRGRGIGRLAVAISIGLLSAGIVAIVILLNRERLQRCYGN